MMSVGNPVAGLVEMIDGCRIVDLSSDVGNHADGPFGTEIEVLEPVPGAVFFCENVLPRIVPDAVGKFGPDDFPDSAFLRHEMVRASTHAGSHIDAPGHYGPSGDAAPGYINDAPLRSFIGPGLMCDVSKVDERDVTLRHIDVPTRVREDIGDGRSGIALIHTGGEKAISREVVEAFLDAGITAIGTDGASFDGPFAPMIDRYLRTRDKGVLWPAHMVGRSRPYYQLERLTNLASLPRSGFLVIAFPVLIGGATAAWTRAAALVPEVGQGS